VFQQHPTVTIACACLHHANGNLGCFSGTSKLLGWCKGCLLGTTQEVARESLFQSTVYARRSVPHPLGLCVLTSTLQCRSCGSRDLSRHTRATIADRACSSTKGRTRSKEERNICKLATSAYSKRCLTGFTAHQELACASQPLVVRGLGARDCLSSWTPLLS
jgi:hypothetical protein